MMQVLKTAQVLTPQTNIFVLYTEKLIENKGWGLRNYSKLTALV
jgi:hypothetical protein